MKLRLLVSAVLLLGAACAKDEEDHSMHRRKPLPIETNQSLRQSVINWERKLINGEFLTARPEHLAEVRQAVLDGVFDPNTILDQKQLQALGPNCTQSKDDNAIGLVRFERTLKMGKELLTATDSQGQSLRVWLYRLNRTDLLKVVEEQR